MSEKKTIQTTVEVFFAYSEALKSGSLLSNLLAEQFLLTLFGEAYWSSLHNMLLGSRSERKVKSIDLRFNHLSSNVHSIDASLDPDQPGNYRFELTFSERVGDLSDDDFDKRNNRIGRVATEVADDVADRVQIAQTKFKDIFQIIRVTARSLRYNN